MVRFRCALSASLALGFVALAAASAHAQGSITVTKWGIRYHYQSGQTDVDERDFDSKEDAIAAAEKYMAANNRPEVSNPGAYVTRYVPSSFPVTITLPRGAPPREQPSLTLPTRPGGNRPMPAPAPAVRPVKLPGSTFTGSENLNGYGALTFEFLDERRVIMKDAKERVEGRWEQAGGGTIYLYFYNDQCVYRGELTGNVLRGTARSGPSLWSWNGRIR